MYDPSVKVYISADIEGVCGITDWSEARLAPAQEFVERMTEEVVAACEGALEAGATEILVKDAHGTGRNILAERLPREAGLVRDWSGHPFCMVQELDESFRAALFVGWHSGAGRGGNPLAHTLSSATVASITINGEVATEFWIHTWAAALVSVPVVMVSGDETLCADVQRFDERIAAIPVMRGEGASTVALHPLEARSRIRDAARDALAGGVADLVPSLPSRISVEVSYKDQRKAYAASFYPGASLESPTSIVFETGDWFEALRMLLFVI